MKKMWKQWFAVKNLVIFFLALWGFTLFSSFLNEYTRPQVQAVHAAKTALSIELQGNEQLEWKDRDAVFSDFGGRVSQVKMAEGEEVTPETVLFRLDLEELKKQLAKLEKSQSEWDLKLQAAQKREAGFFQEERAEKKQAYAHELAEAEQKLVTQEKLYQLGTVSKQAVETARLERDKKRAEEMEVGASLQEREAQVLASRREAEEKSKEIQEELQGLKEIIKENGQVRAKETGVLARFSMTVGGEIQKGQLLYEIAKKSEWSQLVYSIEKKKAEHFKVGDSLNVKHASVNGSLQGEILSIRADPENQDNRLLKIQVATGEIPAGAQVELKHAKRTKVYDLVVPKSAVGKYQNKAYVWVVKEKKKGFGTEVTVVRQTVITGESDDKNVVITSGLSPEDAYVSKILNDKSLAENMKVTWEREEQ
ncbi:hypothetical protein SANA_29230 [Gottschalkiaceae bacterium SANA]|nr:hypothetical protein SANA_29230 [Gottschalkiaceae bacterium SANA]